MSSLATGSEASSPADRWIVRLQADSLTATTTVAEAAQWVTAEVAGLEVVRGLGLPGLLLVTATGLDTSVVVEAFTNNPVIAYFEQDATIHGSLMSDDPEFVDQAGLENTGQDGGLPGADIDIEAAWDITTGSSDIVVAVIDSGVDYNHIDLAANIWSNPGEVPGNLIDDDNNGFIDDVHGWDFRNGDNDPMDDHGHGTHVAGILGAEGNNTTGVTGVAWTSSIMVLKFLGNDNTGFASDAMKAINYATMMRTRTVDPVNLRVMSNSWGSNTFNIGLRDAIAASDVADILFVAAAGNGNIFGGVDNDSLPFYPASYDLDSIISVAASDRIDGLARFSNFGETTVDIAAPGVGILSTEPGDTFGSRSGTSMAAPHVSGVAALLFSNVTGATSAEVKAALLGGVVQLPSLLDKVTSDGRLSAAGALGMDTFSPKPVLDSAPDITLVGATPQTIAVEFTDDTAIDVSTLDDFDVIVTRLDGSGDTFTTSFQSVDMAGNGPVRIAQYEMVPPGGVWDPADNGDYEVSVVAGQISDTVGNVSLATVIGTFNVDVNNPGEFFVNSLLDTVDANPGDGNAVDASGNSTLRAAIQESNAMAGANTIFVASGVFTLSIAGAGEDAATTGDLDIIDTTGTLTIVGAGADKTFIDAAGLDRIFDVSPGVTVSLSGVTLLGGDVTGDGGAILVDGATLTITDSAITDSQATGSGGGLYVSSGSAVDLVRSTFSGNMAEMEGGGIGNLATLGLTNVTVSTNTATGDGGGIHTSGGTATIVNSTVTLNDAQVGGGIRSASGTANLHNTLVAENTASTSDPDVAGSFTSLNNNLIGDVGTATGFGGGTADLVGTLGSEIIPVLSPLQNNTGTTLTHVPLPGSPAIDAGDDTGAPVTDQRLVARPQDGNNDAITHVDIGAVERYFATISGVHFHDLDGNEVQNGAEPGLEGWTIYVDVNGNEQFDAGEPFAITASDGSYTIGGVVPGAIYQVRVVLQEGWEQTAPMAVQGVFMVTDLVDGADANVGDGLNLDASGNRTLRAAIQEANASVGLDTIILGSGIHTLTISGSLEDAAATGDLDITDHVSIVGAGADVTIIDASGLGDRAFDIFASQFVDFTGVTITGGTGTGIGINAAGGGILNRGVVRIEASTIDNNTSAFEGGGVRNLSTGVLTIVDSTFSNNSARKGGGVHSEGGVTVTSSTFSANATSSGTNRRGGAIYQEAGSLTLEASTVTNNTADDEGGGVYVQAGTATAINTVIAANISTMTSDVDVFGVFTSLGNNLIGDIGSATGFNDGVNSDQIGDSTGSGAIDPLLDLLQDNGGTTLTHEPMTGSPLIDAGNNAQARSNDQRGLRRILDGDNDLTDVVDIGSVEFFDGFIVNTTIDTVDANPGDGLAEDALGNTSLRAAIMEANALAGDQSILLDTAIYTLSITGTEMGDASVGDLDITDIGGSLTIFGTSATQTVIDAAGIDRVLNVFSGVTLILRDLTITGGNATATGEEDGAGIYNDGGAITLTRVSLSNNTADEAGGGIFQASGSFTITDTTIDGNSASTGGGGLFLSGGTVDIDRSTISGNSAANGGGAYAYDGTVTIESSTISGNMATSLGGGILNVAVLSILRSTITDNDSGQPGGGIANYGDPIDVFHTIIAGNTSSSSDPDVKGGFNSLGYNLVGIDDATAFGSIGDQAGTSGLPIDPLLDMLADNGGPTETHALLAGSPAMDTGDPAFDPNAFVPPLDFDQRGAPFAREFGVRIDIGAYEFALTPVAPGTNLIVDLLLDASDGDVSVGNLSLREALFLSNLSAGVQTISFDASLDGQQIDLVLGELPITDATTIDASSLADGLTIDAGDGTDATPSTGDGIRIFNIDDGDNLTNINVGLISLTLTGGDTVESGGAIFSRESLSINTSTISGNSAVLFGGAIYSFIDYGATTISSSTISGNSADVGGGGILSFSGTNSTMTISNSTISGNSADFGGGLDLYTGTGSTSEITRSTISGNTATGKGGGIYSFGGLTVVQYSTITANTAPDAQGSGIASRGSSDISTEVFSSIIAGNTGSDVDVFSGATNSFVSMGYNLIGTSSSTPSGLDNFNQLGDQTGVTNPLLGSLADNGGLTETHALLTGSPAADAGDPAITFNPAEFDQRGSPFIRVFDADGIAGARIDMGAYEAQGVVFLVDSLADENDLDHSAGDFSLREAVGLANSYVGSDTITFDASLDGGTILLALGELGITDSTTIDATSLTGGLTIDAQQNSRIFNITATTGDFTFAGLTLTGGKTTGNNSSSSDTTYSGGAIRSITSGNLAIDQSTVSDSSTLGYFANGGGVFADGNVTLTGSTVSGNSTYGDSDGGPGGGIFSSGNVTLTDSIVSDNGTTGAFGYGGGIYASGDVTLTNSTVSGNSTTRGGADGGGIYAKNGNVMLTNSTLSGNSTLSFGADGGGIYAKNGDVMLTNSTVSGNHTDGSFSDGGGITSFSGDLILTYSTVTDNHANYSNATGGGIWKKDNTATTITHSIVAGNTAGASNPDLRPGMGTLTVDYSLFGDNAGTSLVEAQTPDANGNLIGSSGGGGIIDPLLAPLANNGGLTETHALLAGSPAIDAGDQAVVSPPSTDQRGQNRIEDGDGDLTATIDIGAYELAAPGGVSTSSAPLAAAKQGNLGPNAPQAFSIGIPGTGVWTVTVAAGDAFENIDFGVRALPGEIRGQKFHDLNGDGVKDPFEPGLAGWEIYLDDNDNQMHDVGETLVVTDTDGTFAFLNLESEQTYLVAEVAQSEWVQTFPTSNGGRWTIDLGAGEITTSVDLGNVEDDQGGVGTGNIQGVLFSDVNGNGMQDGGEIGLSGETVYLDLNDNGAFDGGEPTAVTDGTGTYQFVLLATGEYAVRVILPSGGTQSSPGGVDNQLLASTLPTETQPNSLVAGDFNRDGHLDIAVVNAGSTTLSVFISDTNGAFLPSVEVDVGTAPLSIQAVQFDDDNGDLQIDDNDYVDLIVGYSGTNFVSVLFNDQTGGFVRSDAIAPYAPWYSASGDFDDDGDIDVVTVHLNQSNVSFLERIPGGFVSPAPTIGNGQDPASLIAVQLSDDNSDIVVDDADRLDLAWVDIFPGANTVTALLNDGGGAFTKVTKSVGGRPFAVAAGDLDGDGFNDLVVTVPETNQVAILFNNQNSNFSLPVFISAGLGPTAIAAGDLDGDGDTDLAVTNSSDAGFALLRNDGTGTFVVEVSGVAAFPNPLAVGIVAAQLDNDPILDLAIANGFGAESVLFIANRLVDRAQRVTVVSDATVSGVDFGIAGIALPSADFNTDGDVDGFDFLAWQLGLGTAAPNATKSDGDADNDLDVDGADLAVWESQYGTTPAPLVAAIVTEQAAVPSSALLTSEPATSATAQGQSLATTVSGTAFSTNIWLALPSVGNDMRPRAIVDNRSLLNQLSAEQLDNAFDKLPSATSLAVTSVESLLATRADEFDDDSKAVNEVFEEWDLLALVPE